VNYINRSAEDRREQTVSHETILKKLVDHDDTIVGMAGDIRTIKNQIIPLTAGIRALTWLGKAFLAIGALAGAAYAIITLWDKVVK